MPTPGQADAFKVEFEGVTYALELDINGMCELEETVSKDPTFQGKEEGPVTTRVTFQDVCARIDLGDMRALRLVVWASLLRHHPEADVKLAGQVATEVLRTKQVTALMKAAIAGATPTAEDAKALGLTPRPRRAQANRKVGTGPRSIAPRAGTA